MEGSYRRSFKNVNYNLHPMSGLQEGDLRGAALFFDTTIKTR